jgi:hypothetical protein
MLPLRSAADAAPMYWVTQFFNIRRTFFLDDSCAALCCTIEMHSVALMMGRRG